MKKMLFVFFCVCCLQLQAQKVTQKIWDLSTIETIVVDAEYVHHIELRTVADTEELTVTGVFEGEYQNQMAFTAVSKGRTITLAGNIQPLFETYDDKLGAHKSLNLALKIAIPENKKVILTGTSTTTNVNVAGVYKHLTISLHDGNCLLNAISGIIKVLTYSGNISVQNYQGKVNASSKYGEVLVNENKKNTSVMQLESVKGSISVNLN